MASLPIYQTKIQELSLMETNWASLINPLLRSQIAQGSLLTNVKLVAGNNTIPHYLGRKLQGWIPVRFHGSWAQIYDLQDSNTLPQLNLILNASAAVEVDLWVM